MSGRAAGYCGGFDAPGFASRAGRGRASDAGGGVSAAEEAGAGAGSEGAWRGFGLAGSLRRGRPGVVAPVPDAEAEQQVLRSQADALRAQLRAVESRLAEGLEKKEKPE
jgi:hypothetical protein